MTTKKRTPRPIKIVFSTRTCLPLTVGALTQGPTHMIEEWGRLRTRAMKFRSSYLATEIYGVNLLFTVGVQPFICLPQNCS